MIGYDPGVKANGFVPIPEVWMSSSPFKSYVGFNYKYETQGTCADSKELKYFLASLPEEEKTHYQKIKWRPEGIRRGKGKRPSVFVTGKATVNGRVYPCELEVKWRGSRRRTKDHACIYFLTTMASTLYLPPQ